ncbi:MAG TPA: c-type cytochrome [bacterium]
MRNILILGLLALVLTVFGCQQQQQMQTVDPVAHGKYLAIIGGCHDCHSPKIFGPQGEPLPDSTRLLSGHPANEPYPTWSPADMQRNAIALTNPMLSAWAGPWGVSFAINLTPDSTGMAEWTAEAFTQAMRTGKHQGQPNGRPILPPMPWQAIGQMTDSDLNALWAYLRSIPPVSNQAPLPVPQVGAPMPAQ